MKVKLVVNRAVVALALAVGCAGLSTTASATPQPVNHRADRAGSPRANAVVTTQTGSSPAAGFQLDYFHAYRASKTYAIRLKNGLQAKFDFENGTATLYQGFNSVVLPLEQVLLQANHGNSQAAAEMYDRMYQSISAAHADAVIVYAGPGIAHTNFPILPPTGGIEIGRYGGNAVWGVPRPGDCWPVPYPCHRWSGGLSNWGTYNQWWGGVFGDKPPTPEPPRPDNCAPDDVDCILWEHDRKIACDDLYWDNLRLYGLDVGVGAACGTALATGGAAAPVCLGGLITYMAAQHKLQKDTEKCRTPYPD